jgi:hypothetical protein
MGDTAISGAEKDSDMLRYSPVRVAALLAVALWTTAPAAEAPGGRALVSVTLDVANASAGPIDCRAAIAHWFSAEVGAAGPGGAVAATLWVDPASGTVHLINAAGDAMPVESLWCGVADATWNTRSLLPLPRDAQAGDSLSLTCRDTATGSLACR